MINYHVVVLIFLLFPLWLFLDEVQLPCVWPDYNSYVVVSVSESPS